MTKSEFKYVMSHPLLLLFAGALFSSLIFPYFTRVWQDAQKELQLQSDLSDLINRAISSEVVAADLSLNPTYSNSQSFVNAFADWRISEPVIHSKIQIYFKDDQITKNWDNLSRAVTQLTSIASNAPPEATKSIDINRYNKAWCFRLGEIMTMHTSYPQNNPVNIDRHDLIIYQCNKFNVPGLEDTHQIQNYSVTKKGAVNWYALFHQNNSTASNQKNFFKSYHILESDIETHKNNLLQSIFNRHIVGYQ